MLCNDQNLRGLTNGQLLEIGLESVGGPLGSSGYFGWASQTSGVWLVSAGFGRGDRDDSAGSPGCVLIAVAGVQVSKQEHVRPPEAQAQNWHDVRSTFCWPKQATGPVQIDRLVKQSLHF